MLDIELQAMLLLSGNVAEDTFFFQGHPVLYGDLSQEDYDIVPQYLGTITWQA